MVNSRVSLAFFQDSSQSHNLKADPAVLQYSNNNALTRYDKAEMMALKETKLAQAPPRCFHDPNMIRLNILKSKQQNSVDYESQLDAFRAKLQNMTLNSWDPKLMELLNNYHNSLLFPNTAAPAATGNNNFQQQGESTLTPFYKTYFTHTHTDNVRTGYNPSLASSIGYNNNKPRQVSWIDQQKYGMEAPAYDRR